MLPSWVCSLVGQALVRWVEDWLNAGITGAALQAHAIDRIAFDGVGNNWIDSHLFVLVKAVNHNADRYIDRWEIIVRAKNTGYLRVATVPILETDTFWPMVQAECPQDCRNKLQAEFFAPNSERCGWVYAICPKIVTGEIASVEPIGVSEHGKEYRLEPYGQIS